MQIDVTVLFELWMERNGPKSLLDKTGLYIVSERIDLGQVDKWILLYLAIFRDQADPAQPFHHEESPGPVECGRHVDRIQKAIGYFHEGHFRTARQMPARIGYLATLLRHGLCHRR